MLVMKSSRLEISSHQLRVSHIYCLVSFRFQWRTLVVEQGHGANGKTFKVCESGSLRLCGIVGSVQKGTQTPSIIDHTLFQDTFDVVIHAAAFKGVVESVLNPLKFYSNNLNASLNLLKVQLIVVLTFLPVLLQSGSHKIVLFQACKEFDVKKFIFSSSGAVYGTPSKFPITFVFDLLPTHNAQGE